jgi:hypothetical protein
MTNLRSGHKYPSTAFNEPEKYLPSFFLEVPFDNLLVNAEVRPLRKDVGYYTVNLNNIFLAHIHLLGGEWVDFLGKTNELYHTIGKLIEEREKMLRKGAK